MTRPAPINRAIASFSGCDSNTSSELIEVPKGALVSLSGGESLLPVAAYDRK